MSQLYVYVNAGEGLLYLLFEKFTYRREVDIMEWALIIYLYMEGAYGYSSAMTTVSGFRTEASCNEALKDIMLTVKNVSVLKCIKIDARIR